MYISLNIFMSGIKINISLSGRLPPLKIHPRKFVKTFVIKCKYDQGRGRERGRGLNTAIFHLLDKDQGELSAHFAYFNAFFCSCEGAQRRVLRRVNRKCLHVSLSSRTDFDRIFIRGKSFLDLSFCQFLKKKKKNFYNQLGEWTSHIVGRTRLLENISRQRKKKEKKYNYTRGSLNIFIHFIFLLFFIEG